MVILKVEVKSSTWRRERNDDSTRFTWTCDKVNIGRTHLLCVVYNKLSFYFKDNDANGTSGNIRHSVNDPNLFIFIYLFI